jgi:hypothetical protein
MEALQILASVAKNFDVAVAPGHHRTGAGMDVEVEECAEVTLGPKKGLYLVMTKRGAAPRSML